MNLSQKWAKSHEYADDAAVANTCKHQSEKHGESVCDHGPFENTYFINRNEPHPLEADLNIIMY